MLVLALLVLIVSSSGWFYLKQTVANRLQTQLASLGMGRPVIGSVTIRPNGIVATDLKFFQPETSTESWLSLGKLAIDHPLVGLITGDQVFNKLKIEDPRVVIDLDQPRENKTFEFSKIELPARVVELTDAKVVLRQQNRTDLALEGISLNMVNSARQLISQARSTNSSTPRGRLEASSIQVSHRFRHCWKPRSAVGGRPMATLARASRIT